MLHPSTKRLIDKLSEMTRKQRVAWSEGENGTITHDTEGYRVVLTPEPHAVLLTDALGKIIESCTPEEFSDDTDAAGRPYGSFVADLYREAHRHARGTEKAIHSVLKGLETIDAAPETEPEVALDPAELIEDPGDDTDSFPEAYPEVEGQNDMARAVASMADELNSGPPETRLETEPEPESVSGTAFGVEPAAGEAEDASEPEAAAEMDDAAYVNFAAFTPEADSNVETESATTPETAEEPLWPVDENAPDIEAESADATHEDAPDPERAPPAEQPASNTLGGGYFGAGTGNLSGYMTTPPPASEAAAEPEPALATDTTNMEADAPAEPFPYTPAFSTDETQEEDDEAAPPAMEAAPAEPTAPRSFSLSGISAGFGLGSASRAGLAPPEPAARAPSTPATDRAHLVIDGTIDLPDDMPVSEFDAGPDTPAYPDPVAEASEAPFQFSEDAAANEAATQETEPEPEPAKPEEQAFEAPAKTMETQRAEEPEAESPPPAPKVTTRFNPWN
tara:strand:- start:836 stop:2356 length:1521 start_codon:yes stop_codon:yes gene_type:complete